MSIRPPSRRATSALALVVVTLLAAPQALAQDAAAPGVGGALAAPTGPGASTPTPEHYTNAQAAPAPQPQAERRMAVGAYASAANAQQGYSLAPQAQVHNYGVDPRVYRGRRNIIGYRDVQQNPPELWGTGLGLFLAGYVLDFAILTPIANAISVDRTGADEQDAWAWSLLPIAGPIVQLAIEAPHPAIPIATGLMQIGGLVLFILGLTETQEAQVPIFEGSPDDPNMLRVGADLAPVDGGGVLNVTLTHL